MRKFLLLATVLFSSCHLFGQGVTTASMNGRITDENGEALIGATVIAVHTPSGVEFGNVTDVDGFYRIPNMRVGGPYTIRVTYVGFETTEEKGVYLNLGQTLRKSVTLTENAQTLEEVVVTSQRGDVFDGNRTGASTYIGKDLINKQPAASRSIADFVRTTPQARIDEGADGFSISLAGQNNRYNAIYIDGAVNNDVFGLAGSGTNGGQTGVNPFSVDAIEAFQVSLAPFDVRVSGFAGGAINAITRSGTNDIEGSAYYFVRNEGLAGKTPKGRRINGEKEKLPEFSAETYGFRLGGPIIKDKAFFFVNYERQNDQLPQPFDIDNYIFDSNASDLTTLENFVRNNYGYELGSFQTPSTLESDKITAKFDFNLTDNHRVSLRHSYVKAENLEARTSDTRSIEYGNGSEFFSSLTNSTSLEVSSRFGNKFSNNLIIGFTATRDDRDPFGDPFPSVHIGDGGSTNGSDGEGIFFGAEPFSTANLLDQDVFTITNNFEYYAGNHTFTAGIHYEYAKAKNLFFAFNFGNYDYVTLDDFLNDANPDLYQRGYSLVSPGAGDESSGAAEFDMSQIGFYIQDEFFVNDNLKLTGGLRFDVPIWSSGPVNSSFNSTTIAALEAAGKDLQGATVGAPINNTVNVSPRFGFNWNVNGQGKTQVRGGVGVFVSRVPLVWPGGAYNNNGITGGFLFAFGGGADYNGFRADVDNQYVGAVPGTGELGGNVDLFAADFKLPKVLKFNIAVDQKLPWWGLIGSLDFIYNDNLQAIYYENLNVPESTERLAGADNRPIYDRGSEIDDDYGRIMLGSNTNEGYSYNITATIAKPLTNGFEGSASYTYGDSRTIFEGTSSQNSSQWRNIQTVNGKNSDLPVTRSDFSLGSRVVLGGSYTKTWNENAKTTLGLFYDGSSGQPFSYIYREGRDVLNDDSRDNALIYVPANASEINLVDLLDDDDNLIATAAEQWAALDAYINGDEYLSERRGQYVERNGDRAPWVSQLDLKFIQEFSLSKNRLQISLDIFNFANLLNSDWGEREFINSDEIPLITTAGVSDNGDGTSTASFNFDPSVTSRSDFIDSDDLGIQSSRWQMQLGIRYIFGN